MPERPNTHGQSAGLDRSRAATHARQDEALRLHNQGVSYIDIARRVGYTPNGRPNAQSAHMAVETARRRLQVSRSVDLGNSIVATPRAGRVTVENVRASNARIVRDGLIADASVFAAASPNLRVRAPRTTPPTIAQVVSEFREDFVPNVGTARVPRPRPIPNIPSSRTYGVEAEFFGITSERACRALAEVGIQCRNHGYTHGHVDQWKIVRDGSVSGTGLELVSPILSGPEGLEQVTIALKALSNAGATVNQTCGIHVHIAADGLTGRDLINVVKLYAANQSHINNLVAQSRHHQYYCATSTLRDVEGNSTYNSIARVTTCGENFKSDEGRRLDRSVASAVSNNGRYHAVNLAAYAKYGTIEFRQHQGSLAGSKVTNWVAFLLALVEKAIATTDAGEDFGSTENLLGSLDLQDEVRATLVRRAETLSRSRIR